MDNNEEKIDLTKYLDRFYKSFMRLKSIVFVFIIVCIAFFEVKTLLFFDTVYSSQAVFIASTEGQSNIFVSSDDNDEFISTFNKVITGDMMRKVIMQDLNKTYVPGTISLSKVPDTNLIELKVTSQDPQDAYDIINCIINNYSQVTHMVMSDVTMSILDTPQLPTQPDAYPNYIKSGIQGFTVGLIISMILIFIACLFRRTINLSDDVKNDLNLTNLAKIPYIAGEKKKFSKISNLLLSNPRIQYHFKQSFHDLRLRIEQEHKKNNSQVFMVTSTMPNEGKSMVSVNTAISLADKGYHVVLVDLDLRNPSILNTIKDSHLSGNIVSYLKGEFTLEEVTNKYLDYSLDVIYGVDSYTNAPELLSKDSIHDFIELLKGKYDFVILDVPPLYMMEDALLVAKQSDTALIVIKQDYVNSFDILEALEELNERIPYIMGTVLNQVKPSIFDQEKSHYGYGYGYGYGRK